MSEEKYDLFRMSPTEILNILLDEEKRDEFLAEKLWAESDYNDTVDSIVNRIMPNKRFLSPLQNYPLYVDLIHQFEKYIDKQDWRERDHNDFDTEFYNYAFYGIRGYVENCLWYKKTL